jgi:glycosyltransferase involved in cell wall biosynthesis
MKYKISDITVVIPTFNRPKELKETLKSFQDRFKDLKEIIIVDQSKDNTTKKTINDFKSKKLKYEFLKIPSITLARNIGVNKTDKKTKIICFLDDDVNIGENYFEEILKVFNENNAKAVQAYVNEKIERKIGLKDYIKKFFFLPHYEKDRARIVSAYGNTYPIHLKKVINAQWLQGANMVYLKEIFKEQNFDENLLGYTVAEDIGFSYQLFKKYPHSVYITPFADILHRYSFIERYPERKMFFINQIDHFYFNYKLLNNNFKEKFVFIWSIVGITILRFLNIFIQRKKTSLLEFKYYLESLIYCLRNKHKIKEGRVREFHFK